MYNFVVLLHEESLSIPGHVERNTIISLYISIKDFRIFFNNYILIYDFSPAFYSTKLILQ